MEIVCSYKRINTHISFFPFVFDTVGCVFMGNDLQALPGEKLAYIVQYMRTGVCFVVFFSFFFNDFLVFLGSRQCIIYLMNIQIVFNHLLLVAAISQHLLHVFYLSIKFLKVKVPSAKDMWYILINTAKLISKEVVAVYNTLGIEM